MEADPTYSPREEVAGRILGTSESDALARLRRAVKRHVYPEDAQLGSGCLELNDD